MQGVNIIEEFVYYSEPIILFVKMLCGVLTMVFAAIIVTAWYLTTLTKSPIGALVSAVMSVILILILVVCWQGALELPNNTYSKYKVTVDDTVNFNEFMHKYEIIEQQGDTYIVRERPTE